MDNAAIILLIVNVPAAVGFGWLLAGHLARCAPGSGRVHRWLGALLGIYLAECAAFSASMGTNVLSVVLAAVWGVVFGQRLSGPAGRTTRTALWISLYSSAPAISFSLLLLPLALEGWAITTIGGGSRFGIPSFVPWPMNTLLGFFLAVSASALILKTSITTSIVALLSARHSGPARRAV